MAFLTIGTYGTLEIDSGGATEEESETGGEDTRAFAGNLRSVSSWTKRKWNFESGWLTQAQYNSLKAAVANAAHVPCSGDALDGATVTCRVIIRSGPYVDDAGVGFWRTARLSLIEV